jgi:integrase
VPPRIFGRRGILAAHGKPSRPAAALTSADVKRLLAACGTNTAGGRDRTLRRSELVAIDREHLRFTTEGMAVFIPRSRHDQEAESATLGIPRGLNPFSCPVRAMEECRKRTRIE